MAAFNQKLASWECESDDGWIEFNAATSNILESALVSGQTTANFQRAHWTYTVNFPQATQRNISTGAVRKVRRIEPGSTSSLGVAGNWECLIDGGTWVEYEQKISTKITTGVAAGRALLKNVHFYQQSYSIDLQRMKQINNSTLVERDIRFAPLPGPILSPSTSSTSSSPSTSSFSGVVNAISSLVSSVGIGSGGGAPVYPSCVETTTANKGFRVDYSMGTGDVDCKAVTNWKVLSPHVDYDPNTKCSITDEPLGMGGPEGSGQEVVALSCTSPTIPCVFRAETIIKCLGANTSCPSCAFAFNIPGPQPSGSMQLRVNPNLQCSGFEQGTPGYRKGTYEITYSFDGGQQHSRMICPGQYYSGTVRYCYIPNTNEGDNAITLLKKAFQQGHCFMVGNSVTTGGTNTVIWGGIHQKTSPHGGATQHGWPDDTYFSRLATECANKGITLDDSTLNTPSPPLLSSSSSISSIATTKKTTPSTKTVGDLQAAIAKKSAEINQAMIAKNTTLLKALMAERSALIAQKSALL